MVFSGWSERYWRNWANNPPKEPRDGAPDTEWYRFYELRDEYQDLYYNEPERYPEMEDRPQCDYEDLAAFQALLGKIGQAQC